MRTLFLAFAIAVSAGLATAQTSTTAELVRKAAVWNEHRNYSETEIEELPSSIQFDKKIPLTVVILKNSDWKKSEVIEKIRRTEEIFGVQCHVSFSPILLVSTRHAAGSYPSNVNGYVADYVDVEKMLFSNAAMKPIIFMVDGQDPNDGREFEGGVAYRSGKNGRFSPALNSVILYRAHALDFSNSYPISQPMITGDYEVMAHELGHVLFDQSHISELQNLMSEKNDRTNRITQCDRIAKSGF